MSQPMTPAAVHKQYDEAMTAFRRQLADPAARVAFGREADTCTRAQMMTFLWRVAGRPGDDPPPCGIL